MFHTRGRRGWSFSSEGTTIEAGLPSPSLAGVDLGEEAPPLWQQLSTRDLVANLNPQTPSIRQKGRPADNIVQQLHTTPTILPSSPPMFTTPVIEQMQIESVTPETQVTRDPVEAADYFQPRARQKSSQPIPPFPQNITFWYDYCLARVSEMSTNLDIKAQCLRLMAWREAAEVPRNFVFWAYPSHPTASEEPITDELIASISHMTAWDTVLADMRAKSIEMHRGRKGKNIARRDLAAKCQAKAQELVTERGEFVEEYVVGREIERSIGDEHWVIKLGYRRNDAIAKEMDLDATFDA